MFVAHVDGQSMEPLIPDGSLNPFRYGVQGSRQGKGVLIDGSAGPQRGDRVKRYTSSRCSATTISGSTADRFRAENREYESWSPEPGEFRILAKWLGTLE